ncbi:MAG TPA: hypothetical protein VGH13_09830, partial [Xanthobacteraceae bacterium]
MRRRLWLAGCAAIIWIFGTALAFAGSTEPPFKHGATLVEFFQFPKTVGDGPAKHYADPAFPGVQAALRLFDFAELRRDGFDHIRLLIDVGPLLASDGAQLNAVMAQLHAVIAELHRHGLAVLVTLLPPAPGGEVAVPLLDGLRGPRFERYVTLAARI